jgi:endonuclease/exonuclease/phosphatase family metal-dependent hydrolase
MEFVEGHKYVLDSARNSKIRSITDRLVENSIYRGAQARKVKEFIERSQPMKIIVCGDFNDTPLSYTYKTIAQQLTDTFIAAGNGYRYTFNGFFKLLPIDYILASKHFNVLSYEADYTMGFSDHYPVITRMRINKD